LIVPGKLFVVYLPYGGALSLVPARTDDLPGQYRVIDPKSGALLASGEGHGVIVTESGPPSVVIFADFDQRRK
jgi:hypothetical protein